VVEEAVEEAEVAVGDGLVNYDESLPTSWVLMRRMSQQI
jgi:hypothetical protein